MAVLHQKLDPMLLGLDRIGGGLVQEGQGTHVEFVAARKTRGAGVCFDHPTHQQAALLGGGFGRLKLCFGHLPTQDNCLAEAAAVAHLQKHQLAFASFGLEPATERHFLVDEIDQCPDRHNLFVFLHRVPHSVLSADSSSQPSQLYSGLASPLTTGKLSVPTWLAAKRVEMSI